MANVTKPEREGQVLCFFNQFKSIKRAARELGISRNTVRRIVRQNGLLQPTPTISQRNAPARQLDFAFLEKLFELGRERAENTNFEITLKSTIRLVQQELGAEHSPLQTLRIEVAFLEYINYRRFYLKAFTASQGTYEGPYMAAHDRLAKAVDKWVAAG